MSPSPATLRDRPPAGALAWAAGLVGRGAVVRSVRWLPGGSSSAMHGLTVATAEGTDVRVVLRRHVDAAWLAREPDLAGREAAVLRALPPGVAPGLVGVDVDGSVAGAPAVVMTRLPGRSTLAPPDLDRFVDGVARALAGIHAVAPPSALGAYRSYYGVDVPVPRPVAPDVLVHRDFHPGNVLWSRGRLTGVVDWLAACRGPAATDVGHCRHNLHVAFGAEAADAFLAAYRSFRPMPDDAVAWGDLASALDMGPGSVHGHAFRALGRPDLTDEVIAERRASFLARASAR